MAIDRKKFSASDQAYFHAWDSWQPTGDPANIFSDLLSPDEIQRKLKKHRPLLDKALAAAQSEVDLSQDWDQVHWSVFSQMQSAALYYLFTGDQQAVAPALAALTALEQCERPYWSFSSCIGVLDMDLRTAEATLCLAMMKACMGGALDPETRRRLSRLMVERCLQPGLAAERDKTYPWMHSQANWRIILCGCLAIGGMAFAEDFPEHREIIEYGIEGVLASFQTGDRAGGWNEGPGYWDYGLGYAVAFARCLRLYTGGAVDLFKHPFLQKTGDFRLFMHTRTDEIWNWSDAGKKAGPSLTLLGLARAYQSPAYQWLALAQGLKTIGQLYVLDPALKAKRPASVPTRKHFPDLGVLVWREGFGPRDTYVGVKAGDIPELNHHCHMDFGALVIHAEGRELLAELEHWPYPYEGRKDTKVKGYQPGFYDLENKRWMRWDFDDLGAIGHNVVTLEGNFPQAAIGVKARLLKLRSGEGYETVIIDSTPAYRPLATRVRRYVVYLRPDLVLLVDELRSRRPVRARVLFHPAAGVDCDSDSFTFRNGPARLLGSSLYPRTSDHLILGLDDRRTNYQPPNGIVAKRNRYVYIENLYRKPRLVFVTALQFGRKDLAPATFALTGSPSTDDEFSVDVQRASGSCRVGFNLRTGAVQLAKLEPAVSH